MAEREQSRFIQKVFSTKLMERYFALYPNDEARAMRHYECNLILAWFVLVFSIAGLP